MKPIPLINVIIVTYNSENFIKKCLESLINQTYNKNNYFITIVDNGSSDNTINIVKRFSQIRIILNKKNLGFAKANNIALKYSNADYAILLNQDSIVGDDFILSLVDVMESNSQIAVCGGAEHPYKKILKSHRVVEETNWVGLGATILRITTLKKIGFLDENYIMYCEDLDLCWRLKFSGYKVYYTPFAIWHHYGHARKIDYLDMRVINSSISRLYLLFKFASFKQIIRSLKYYFRKKNTSQSQQSQKNKVFQIINLIL